MTLNENTWNKMEILQNLESIHLRPTPFLFPSIILPFHERELSSSPLLYFFFSSSSHLLKEKALHEWLKGRSGFFVILSIFPSLRIAKIHFLQLLICCQRWDVKAYFLNWFANGVKRLPYTTCMHSHHLFAWFHVRVVEIWWFSLNWVKEEENGC